MAKKTTLGDIMWRDILKDSKQVSRTMGSIDWENEEIPEQDDDDCLKWVRELRDLTRQFRSTVLSDPTIREGQDIKFFDKIGNVPNKIVCKVIQHIKDNPDNYYYENDWHEIKGTDYGYIFQHYYGDGHQGYIMIGKSWNDSPIKVGFDTDNSQPYYNHLSGSNAIHSNPEYLGDRLRDNLRSQAVKINAHMQKIWPDAKQYNYM